MRLGSCYVRSPGAGGCDTRLHYVRFSVYNSRDFYFNTARPMPAPAVVLPYGDEEVRNRALHCTSQAQFVPSIKNAEYEITVESVVATLDIIYGIFGDAPFPSFGLGNPLHLIQLPTPSGPRPPPSGCHCSRPTGQGLHRPPSPDSPLVGGSRIISVLKFKFLYNPL